MATLYFPGAYLHEDMPKDKRILMKSGGYFADIMFQVNPEYDQHVSYDNGGKFCIYYFSGDFIVSLILHCCYIISSLIH